MLSRHDGRRLGGRYEVLDEEGATFYMVLLSKTNGRHIHDE